MSADDELSKRDRHKQRREAKLQEEREAAKRARRNRLMAFIGVGVVVAGLIGFAVQRNLAQRAELAAAERRAEEKLTELGCTPDEEQPDASAGHLETDPASLAAADPAVLYPDRPASSGQHLPLWVKTGVFDKQIDERLLVHNLEHGYVTMFYAQDAPADQVSDMKGWAQEQIDGDYKKLIVSEWVDSLPDEAKFAFVDWGDRQLCRGFDADVAGTFLRKHEGGKSAAPEAFVPAHLEAGGGAQDPDAQDGPLLFPPLGAAPVPEGGMDESSASPGAAGSEPAVDAAPTDDASDAPEDASEEATEDASAEAEEEPSPDATAS